MSEITRPGASVVAITTSDSADIATLNGQYPRAIYVGVGGDVVIVTPDGKQATLKNAANGQLIPIQARRVMSTSTTATNLIGIY